MATASDSDTFSLTQDDGGTEAAKTTKPKKPGRPAKAKEPEKPAKAQEPEAAPADWTLFPTAMLPIDKIVVVDRIRQKFVDIDKLADSIDRIGQLQPILVSPPDAEGCCTLIAGERRLRALKALGRTEAWCAELDYDKNPDQCMEMRRRAEHDENELRQPFTAVEKLAAVEAIEKSFKGKPRAKAGEGRARRKAVAKAVDWSHETLRQAKAVQKAAKENPDRFGDLLEAMGQSERGVNAAFKQLKARTRPTTDRAGFTLPDSDKACAPWVADGPFGDLITVLSKARAALNDVAHSDAGGRLVASGRLRATGGAGDDAKVRYKHDGFDELSLLLRSTRPYAQCPTCAAEHGELGKYTKRCPTCGGEGHVDEKTFDTMQGAKDPAVKKLKDLSDFLKKAQDAQTK